MLLQRNKMNLGPFVCVLTAAGVGGVAGCSSPSDRVETTAITQHALVLCDPSAPFGPPVAAFTGTRFVDGITFTQDYKRAYFSARLNGATQPDIYMTERPSTEVPFIVPSGAVEGLNTGYGERMPMLTPDGRRLYFGKYINSATRYDLWAATIDPVTGAATLPAALPGTNINANYLHEQDPFYLAITPNTGQLFFAKEPDDGQRDLYVASYSSSPPPNGIYSNVVALTPNAYDEYGPVLSADGLTLYFASTRPGVTQDTGGDIFVVTRMNASDGFDLSQATGIAALASSRIEYPVALSPDGCTLYFASNRDTPALSNYRLYQTTRGTNIPSTATTTLKIVGASGSIISEGYECSATCTFQGAPDSAVFLEATAGAIWSGSCSPAGGQGSSDGYLVFSDGGICTITFGSGASSAGGGCANPNGCQAGLECTLNVCRCPPGSANCASCDGDSDCKAGVKCCAGVCGGGGDPMCNRNVCRSDALQVVDVHSDFRDIWAEREDILTGKRTDPHPTIALTFNEPINPDRVNAFVVGYVAGTPTSPRDCVGTQPATLELRDLVPVRSGAESWATPLSSGNSDQRVPLDFDVVAFGDLIGLRSAEGPVLVGGDATVQTFQFNNTALKQVGLIVAGKLTATSGTVAGDFAHSKTAPNLQAVSILGDTINALPVDIDMLHDHLEAVSARLEKRGANGTISRTGGSLSLLGANATLNVFSIASSSIAQLSSITISIPNGSAALINVEGEVAAFTNAAVQMAGGTGADLLWNFAGAHRLDFTNVDFLGSTLAPGAAAYLQGGQYRGTLIAESVQGDVTFRHQPLASWARFGTENDPSTTVVLSPAVRLFQGCQYELVVDTSPKNDNGACLAEPFLTPFMVADAPQSAFDRETGRRQFHKNGRPTFFEAAGGINTKIDEVFDRYAATIGLRRGVDSMLASPLTVADPRGGSGELTWYQQNYQGVPVDGFGYAVRHSGEIFRSALGHVASDVSIDVSPSITEQSAIALALNELAPATMPWTAAPPQGPAPTATLRIVAGAQPAELVWRARFSGLPEGAWVDVNAKTGEVIHVEPSFATALPPIACMGFDSTTAELVDHTYVDATVDFSALTSVDDEVMTLGLWQQGGQTFEVFRNREPFSHDTVFQDSNEPSGQMMIQDVCNTPSVPANRWMSTAHWALQAAERSFGDLAFGGQPWRGLGGTPEQEPLYTIVVVPPADPNSPINGMDGGLGTSFRPRTRLGDVAKILVNTSQGVFAPLVAHEFAHGVLYSSRGLSGFDPLQLTGEPGALGEAYADIMAAVMTRKEGFPPWCLPSPNGLECDRNLAAPNTSGGLTGPSPDTYLADTFWVSTSGDCTPGNDRCGVHKNSTVASHWFYQLTGGPGGAVQNKLGCVANVTRIDEDPDVAMHMAAQVVFTAFATVPTNADMFTVRDQTAVIAHDLYGPEAQRAVESAWVAVGVGSPPKPEYFAPKDGATAVRPWPVTFEWSVEEQVGPWMLRWSTRPDFLDATPLSVFNTKQSDGRRVAFIDVPVPVESKIYWQAREGVAPGSSESWSDCETFTGTFETAKVGVRLIEPKKKLSGGYYRTDPVGSIRWEIDPGFSADEYRVVVTRNVADCDASGSQILLSSSNVLSAYLGDTLDNPRLFGISSPFIIAPSADFDPDHTYHLYIRPRRADGLWGSCSHFAIRKPRLGPFKLLSPISNPWVPILPYGSGGPFVWAPSDGAESYELVLTGERRQGIYTLPGTSASRRSEIVTVDDVSLNVDGNIEYTLVDASPTTLPGEFHWEVIARGGGFERRGWDPGASMSFDANLASFDAAPEPIASLSALPGGRAANLDAPPSTMVTEHRFGTPRTARLVFGLGNNTRGVTLFRYRSDQEPESFFAPIASEGDATIEIDDVPIPDEGVSEILAFYPVSTLWENGGYVGAGPVLSTEWSTIECGGAGQPCCMGDSCEVGACRFGSCQDPNCGIDGESCCENGPCLLGSEQGLPGAIVYCGNDDLCHACGALDLPCCPGGNYGGCPQMGTHCRNGECQVCGGDGQRCCENKYCPYSEFSCRDGRCQPAMPPNGPPAPQVARRCNEEIVVGANDGGRFEVDVGKTSGAVWFVVNTLTVPDEITVSYEETKMREVPCVGTGVLPNACDEWRVWCCDGGACQTRITYSGSSSMFVVDVEPNCSGTTDTAWGFMISCPP